MRDASGTEWVSIPEAARATRVRPETIRVWVHRGKVRRHEDYVNLHDVRLAEHAWRARLAGRSTS